MGKNEKKYGMQYDDGDNEYRPIKKKDKPKKKTAEEKFDDEILTHENIGKIKTNERRKNKQKDRRKDNYDPYDGWN